MEERHRRKEAGITAILHCVNNSRRLGEARPFYFKLVQDLAAAGRQLRIGDAEGNHRVLEWVSFSQRSTATWLPQQRVVVEALTMADV